MSNFATLDREDQSIFDVDSTEETSEQLLTRLESDPNFQRDIMQQNKAQQVNIALAQEIMAILQEMDGNNFDISEGSRFINWETTDTPYQILRKTGSIEAGRLIKNKRRLDFAQYGKPPKAQGIQRGAHLVFSNTDYSPTKEEKMKLKQWEMKIFKNFFFAANDIYPNFGKFIGNAYEDYFDLDDITIEIRRNNLGRPLAIQLQDPILWKPVIKKRRAINMSLWEETDGAVSEWLKDYETMILGEKAFMNKPVEEPDYLLIHENQRLAAADSDWVRKFHFFTRSDYRKAQRGFSIVEQGINIATWIINALKRNASNFSNSRLPRGFVAFTGGGVGTLQLEKLKKIMYAHMAGTNPNRFPMIGLNGEKSDAKWVGVDGTSKDMEYHLWITLIFSIWCQLSGTDPRELSIGAHSDAVKGSSLNSESTDGIVKESNDKGAKTFLSHIQDSLNTPDSHGQNVFQQITGMDVELEFIGFEIEDKKMKYEIRKNELATTKSINQLLAEDDKDKQTLMIGDKNIYDIVGIGSTQLFQAIMSSIQQQQAQMGGGQLGVGGGEAEGQIPGQGGGQISGQTEGQPNGQQGGEGGENLTEADKRLIEKYGQPENVE